MYLLKYKKIIDLRNISEILKYGKIPNSKNIQIDDFKKLLQNGELNKNDKILVYCWSGLRSNYAIYLSKLYGYNNIEDLQYGFKIFSKIGLKKYKECTET